MTDNIVGTVGGLLALGIVADIATKTLNKNKVTKFKPLKLKSPKLKGRLF